MMPKDPTFAQQALLGIIGGGSAPVKPATTYVGLFTTLPGGTPAAGVEVAGNGYARVAVTNDGTGWGYTAPNTMKNIANIQFSGVTGPGWGNIVGFGIFANSSGATGPMWYGPIDNPQTIIAGDLVIFTAGTLVVTED
jgi:hypothetical protein